MNKFSALFFVFTASLVLVAESSNTIQKIIFDEKRFVVFNSRSLSGECLSICKTSAPTGSPTGTDPTKPPATNPTTDGSTGLPTSRPTTKEPTAYPTVKPTKSPTNAPTKTPTQRPTINPTKSPTTEPTRAPTKNPTNPPTKAAPSHECVWPKEKFSAITKEDMISGAHSIYHKVVVGGKLKNPSNSNVVIDGRVYYGKNWEGNFNFNKGSEKFDDWESIDIDYEHFEWLAQNMKNSDKNGKKVVVKTTGKDGSRNGCYDLYDFRNGGQGYDNGNTLVVFNTTDDICLTKTTDGRQFGPSVLAPFSKVTLKDAGFIDGAVVAKKFTTVVGSNTGSELQLHGALYNGAIECI